jgi:prepilin-type N-terminal cleavage/methylation domain-containing protein
MKFVSIGIRAASRSFRRQPRDKQGGFTLLEALVALTIVLAFAAALGPFLFQARRIMINADGRVAAQILLRALLADPPDPTRLGNLARDGEGAGLHWRVTAEPTSIEAMFPPRRAAPAAGAVGAAQPPPNWVAYRVAASVSWAPGQRISAETVRLGKGDAVPQ